MCLRYPEFVTPYSEFRTGLTYHEVYLMLWSESEDRTTWRHKRRGTVLGLWHQLKQQMYDRYLEEQEKDGHQS